MSVHMYCRPDVSSLADLVPLAETQWQQLMVEKATRLQLGAWAQNLVQYLAHRVKGASVQTRSVILSNSAELDFLCLVYPCVRLLAIPGISTYFCMLSGLQDRSP